MTSTRNRPRHQSDRRSSDARHSATSFTFSTSGDLPIGAEWVEWHAFFKKFHATANKYGRTCSGFGLTREEAVERARAICDELEAKRAA